MTLMTSSISSLGVLILLTVIVLTTTYSTQGQSGTWKYGFELGWSNSKIVGDLEVDDMGKEAETQSFNPGFHLSFYARRHFTDNSGLQFGLAYAQRGGINEFDGHSYYTFGQSTTSPVTRRVFRRETQDILNGYLDIPVIVFHKFGNRLEVGAGVYGGILIASKSDGDMRISDAQTNIRFDPFFVTTEKKYLRDNFGDAVEGGMQDITFSGQTIQEPRIIGAYYEFLEDPGESLYNRMDYGVIGQVGFYFNESLNLKVRLSYGLADVTKQEADLAKGSILDNTTLNTRDDKDRNLSMQISLGFLF